MGSKIYGPTTLGPHCKVGGEVNNSVFFGYSSKAHDGFLGNSVIGEWCNLGADTNNSNLKNNYDEVKLWNYEMERFKKTGLQFCGLIMGDHSKCGINTMFNTGTVIGVSANIYMVVVFQEILFLHLVGEELLDFKFINCPKYLKLLQKYLKEGSLTLMRTNKIFCRKCMI
jgi:hypothetical protein